MRRPCADREEKRVTRGNGLRREKQLDLDNPIREDSQHASLGEQLRRNPRPERLQHPDDLIFAEPALMKYDMILIINIDYYINHLQKIFIFPCHVLCLEIQCKLQWRFATHCRTFLRKLPDIPIENAL